ncbi:MAG: T9SS type A sorting domain-containing protein, partial [Syntrophothermus sp.]
ISPRMHLGSTPKIGLWTETFNPTYGMEKYKICVSTKSANPADFVVVSGLLALEAPMNWGYQVVNLGAYADSTVFVAIQCVSDNTFLFMVDDIQIGSSVGIDEQTPADPFVLYPNPVTDHLFLKMLGPGKISEFSIMDMTGKCVLSQPVGTVQEILSIDTRDLQRGIYFISVVLGDDQRIIRKFVVEK